MLRESTPVMHVRIGRGGEGGMVVVGTRGVDRLR